MASEYIYVHLDSVTNSVLSKGITFFDYEKIVQNKPNNILLLNTTKDIGEFDMHTGFRMIRGADKVQQYFDEYRKGSYGSKYQLKWIDFDSIELLHELTPIEISEILYLGHAYTHLHSPFNYKLQNNFIFLTMPDKSVKQYYREINYFYSFLASELTKELKLRSVEKKLLFKKTKSVQSLPIELVQEMVPLLREGICFLFDDLVIEKDICEIPIYLVEDRVKSFHSDHLYKDLLAYLCFDYKKQTWFLKEEQTLAPSL